MKNEIYKNCGEKAHDVSRGSSQEVNMKEICGCSNATTLTNCEKRCPKYSSCNNVAIANDILAEKETKEV